MRDNDRAQADALDRVWDALVGGLDEAVTAGELDPVDRGTPSHLAALERAAMHRLDPVPEWSLVQDRMWRGSATASEMPTQVRAGAAARHRHTWSTANWDRGPVGSDPAKRWWPPLELAIGVAVIVVLVGIVFEWDLGRFGDDPSPPRASLSGAPEFAASSASPTQPIASSTSAPSPTAAPTEAPASFDADGDGFMTINEFSSAVAATIPDFSWPPAYRVSAELIMGPPRADPRARTSRYEVGSEQTIIGVYHRCAWEQTWLDAHESGDEALAAEALAVMTDILPYNVNNAPDTRAHFVEVARRAASGDPALVVQDLTVNCASIRFLEPAATPGA